MTDTLRCPDGHVTVSTDYCDVCGLPMTMTASPPPSPDTSPAGLSLASSRTGPAVKTCPNCQTEVPAGDLFCENCGYDFTTGQLPVDPSALAPSTNSLQLPPPPSGGPGAVPVAPATSGPDQGSAQQGAAAQGGAGQGGAAATVAPSAVGPAVGQPTGGVTTVAPGASTAAPVGQAGQGPVPPIPAGPLTWVAELWIDPDWFATQESEDVCPSAGMPAIIPLWERSLLVGRVSTTRNIHPQIDCGGDHGVSRRHAQLTTDGQRWWVEDLQSSNGTFVGVAGAPLPTAPVTPGQRTEFSPGDRVYVGAWTRIVVRKAAPDEA